MATLQATVERCLDEILQHPQGNDVRAVGMDTFVGNMLGVDMQGKAVTPVYSYADTRSAEDVTALAPQLDVLAQWRMGRAWGRRRGLVHGRTV